MGLVQNLADRFRIAEGQAVDWPPRHLREHWERIEEYRLRFQNDPGLLIPYSQQYSRASYETQTTFTPVPLAREICRYSAALLFNAPAKLTLEFNQEALDELIEVNALDPFWQQSAETVANEGRGAIRVIRDDEVSDQPLLSYVHEDQLLWDEKHGRFVVGGAVVIEHEPKKGVVLRLVEEHERGVVRRTCYRGDTSRLGRQVALDEHPEGDGLEEEEFTGLSVPTLIRWDNVPGGHSDLYAIEVLLDRLDEAESIFTDKGRKSVPVVFGDRSLADAQGRVERSGVILTGSGQLMAEMGEEGKGSKIETVQPALQAAETIAWIEHTREMALTLAGYSLASWGLGEGGTADSGTALRLRQARTLLTRAAKERMAREAMTNAVATALAWKLGASEIRDFRPQIEFGDGLPRDEMQLAQTIATLRGAETLSTEEAVRMFNPSWTEDEVDEEVERIEGEGQGGGDPSAPPPAGLNRVTDLITQRLGANGQDGNASPDAGA